MFPKPNVKTTNKSGYMWKDGYTLLDLMFRQFFLRIFWWPVNWYSLFQVCSL